MKIMHLFFLCWLYFCSAYQIVIADEHPVAHTKTIKVGLISGLTGAAAKWDRYQNMGVTLAKEELEAQGWKIDLVIEDSQTNSAKAIGAFNKLVSFDKVQAVLTNDYGFVIAPIIPLVDRVKILTVSTSSPSQLHCDRPPGYFFSISTQISLAKKAYTQFFDRHPEIKKIGLVTFDDPEWGGSYAKLWKEIARERGIQIVDHFASSVLLPDFKSALTRMIHKKPDAILQAHEPDTFLKTILQLGYKGKVLFANHVYELLADAQKLKSELNGIF